MTSLLHAALSARARFLLGRDGHTSKISGVLLGAELVLPDLYLNVDGKGILSIDYNSVEAPSVFVETGEGVVLHTSPTWVLQDILAILGRYTVLDDLSSV